MNHCLVYHPYCVQGKLAINPLALAPGATPPTNTPTEKAVSFDEPIQPKTTLTSLTKV